MLVASIRDTAEWTSSVLVKVAMHSMQILYLFYFTPRFLLERIREFGVKVLYHPYLLIGAQVVYAAIISARLYL